MIDDRDYVGYGADPPNPQWPGGARIAVNINLNFEGGGERSVMHGDGVSEGMLNDIGFPSLPGLRSPMVESVFEYGSRVGGWRLLRLFRRFGVKVCLLAVAKAAERNPEITRAFVEEGHEIVSHGYRWLDYQTMPEEREREHVRLGIETIERIAGVRPVGWMTGRPSANTRRLHLELGGFLYDRDSLNDELPYWVSVGSARHLIIPYSFETNDNRFDENRGFSTGDDYVAGIARPADRPPRPDHWVRQVSRSRHSPRPRVDLHRTRNRGALAARPSAVIGPLCGHETHATHTCPDIRHRWESGI